MLDLVGRPRLPKAKPGAMSDEARARKEEATLAWIEAYLARLGLTPGWIKALARSYAKRGAARGLVAELEREWSERVTGLETLVKAERRAHAELHSLLGGADQVLDLAPQSSAHGGRTKQIRSVAGEPCSRLDDCRSWRREIRDHARHVRWLEDQLSTVREIASSEASPARTLHREIESRGAFLKEKGAIVAHLVDELGLDLKHSAILVLVHGMRLKLPLTAKRIDDQSHAMSVAAHDWRKRQAGGRARRQS